MPIYCFTCDSCGGYTEEQRTMADASKPKTCDCGQSMRRDLRSESRGRRNTPGTWPMESDAAGVHPDDVPEMMKKDAEYGVKTEYTRDGNPIFTGPEHRRKYCRVHGLFDRNAGYGDPTPIHQ
jgi:putative FmdB family regulatory protein